MRSWRYATVLSVLVATGCGGPERVERPQEPPVSRVPKPSGDPIVQYRLLVSAARAYDRHALLARKPTERELIDVALDLHAKYPTMRFTIIDAEGRGLKQFEYWSNHSSSDPYEKLFPEGWANKHLYAGILPILEHGEWKWRLGGWDASIHNNEVICDLEDRAIDLKQAAEEKKRREFR